MKIFVGNLPFSTTQEELEALFSESGAGDLGQYHHRSVLWQIPWIWLC